MNYTRPHNQLIPPNKKSVPALRAGQQPHAHLSQPKDASATPAVIAQSGAVDAATGAMTTEELISRAKSHIGTGETSRNTSFRAAADYIARACDQGATQREVAEGVGKSPAWVNCLLKWREGGYVGAPFADKIVQGVNKGNPKPDPASPEPASASAACTPLTVSESAKYGCLEPVVKPGETVGSVGAQGGNDIAPALTAATKTFSRDQRAGLIEHLEFLAAKRPRLRAKFALNVEQRRAELGLTWDELLISAGGGAASAVLDAEPVGQDTGVEESASEMPDIPEFLRRDKAQVTYGQIKDEWHRCRDHILGLDPKDQQRLIAECVAPFVAARQSWPEEASDAISSPSGEGSAR